MTVRILKAALIYLATILLISCNTAPTRSAAHPTIQPPVREFTRQINGIETYIKTVGKGAPIVMLHGGPGFDHHHLSQMNALADQYQLIYYDQRGSGNSSGAASATSINMPNLIQDLEALRKEFKLKKMNLLGASFGGLIALYYATHYPEHLGSLVLVGSVPASLEDFATVSTTIEKRTSAADKKALEQITTSEAYLHKDPKAHQEFFRILFKTYLHNPSLASQIDLHFGKNTLTNMNTINELMYQNLDKFDIYNQLATIHCPTLILHGDEDPFPYAAAEKIHAHIQSSEFELLPQTGHFLYLENPDYLFDKIRAFYQKHLD